MEISVSLSCLFVHEPPYQTTVVCCNPVFHCGRSSMDHPTVFTHFLRKCSLVPRPLFFSFLFGGDGEKRVWWISVGRFVLLTPRFWELLIGINNYKGHPLNDVPLLRAQKSNAHETKEHR